MKILDKLLGRKNDLGLEKPSYTPLGTDELGLGEFKTDDFTTTPPGPEDMGPTLSPFRNPQFMQQPQFQQPAQQMQQPASRDVELILSRLDTIRSLLTNLDLRIARLERAAGVDEKENKRW